MTDFDWTAVAVEDAPWSSDDGAQGVFDPKGFGRRLKAARVEAAVPQTKLAAALGMSQATYSRLEAGRAVADKTTATMMDILSRELGRSMKWLLEGSPVRERVRLAARKSDEEPVHDRAERVLTLLEVDAELDDIEKYVDLAAHYDGLRHEARRRAEHVDTTLTTGLGQVTLAQGTRLGSHVRSLFGLGLDPIEDLPTLIEDQFGIDLAVLPLGEKLSAVAAFDDLRDVALVAVSSDEPYARQRFSFAHEVAHILFGEGHVDGTPGERARSPRERRADKFAQELLLPAAAVERWLEQSGTSGRAGVDDACMLAETYGVSPQMAWVALGSHAPFGKAPSAATAAIRTGHVARFYVRDALAQAERVPARIETRVLAAYRAGFMTSKEVAHALGHQASVVLDEAAHETEFDSDSAAEYGE